GCFINSPSVETDTWVKTAYEWIRFRKMRLGRDELQTRSTTPFTATTSPPKCGGFVLGNCDRRRLLGYLPLGSGCALKTSRVSCLVITLSSSSAPASLSRSITAISGRICCWVSSRSCSVVWAGTERAVAERRRLVMIRPSLRTDNVASAARFLFFSSEAYRTRDIGSVRS